MVDHGWSGAAAHAARPEFDEADERADAALRYWLEQEAAPLPDASVDARDGRWPGGWWLVPALVLAVPVWVALISWLS